VSRGSEDHKVLKLAYIVIIINRSKLGFQVLESFLLGDISTVVLGLSLLASYFENKNPGFCYLFR